MRQLVLTISFFLFVTIFVFAQTPEQKLVFSGPFYSATLKKLHFGCWVESWYDDIIKAKDHTGKFFQYKREGKCTMFAEGVEVSWMQWKDDKIVIRLKSDPNLHMFTTKKAINP